MTGLLVMLLAQAPMSRVVLLKVTQPDAAWPAVERRIQTELALLSVEVVVLPAPALDAEALLGSLDQLAREHRAAASLCLVRRGTSGHVRLWVGDQVTGKSLVRDLNVGKTDSPDVVAQAAFRAVELLQASFAELVLARPPAASRTAPVVEAVLQGQVARPLPRWTVGIAPSLVLPTNRVSATGGGTIEVGLRLVEVLRLEAAVHAAVLGGEVEDPRGRTRIGLAVAQLGARWEPTARARLWPSLGGGVGGLLAWARATTAAQDQVQSPLVVVPLLFVSAGLAARPAEGWEVGLTADVGATIPTVRLLFDGEPLATVGGPWVAARLSLRKTFE